MRRLRQESIDRRRCGAAGRHCEGVAGVVGVGLHGERIVTDYLAGSIKRGRQKCSGRVSIRKRHLDFVLIRRIALHHPLPSLIVLRDKSNIR